MFKAIFLMAVLSLPAIAANHDGGTLLVLVNNTEREQTFEVSYVLVNDKGEQTLEEETTRLLQRGESAQIHIARSSGLIAIPDKDTILIGVKGLEVDGSLAKWGFTPELKLKGLYHYGEYHRTDATLGIDYMMYRYELM